MVASTITIKPIKIDGRDQTILTGGVSSIDDDTNVHESDSRTTITTERSDRVRRKWQVSWSVASLYVTQVYEICRNSFGFLFISPIDDERVATDMPLKNTVTGLNTGDGSTAIFQLQWGVTLAHDTDIEVSTSSSDYFDVNYPIAGTVTVKANGVSATVSSVNYSTGRVTLSAAPANGAAMTASFERKIPVLWTSKSLSRTLLQVDQTEVRSGQFEEIF